MAVEFTTEELDDYINALPTHDFITEKPANEPYPLDKVRGWWGEGFVSDVAETQGSCRVVTTSDFAGFWIENTEIDTNLTALRIALPKS